MNRDVLKWVKQWDYCVFGIVPPSETQRDKIIKSYRSTFGGNANGFKGNKPEKVNIALLDNSLYFIFNIINQVYKHLMCTYIAQGSVTTS